MRSRLCAQAAPHEKAVILLDRDGFDFFVGGLTE